MSLSRMLASTALIVVFTAAAAAPTAQAKPKAAPMMATEAGYEAQPLLTVGQSVNSTNLFGAVDGGPRYTPVGVYDGIGAFSLDENTVRILTNHELLNFRGSEYQVSDGAGGSFGLTGSRISYFDVDKETRQIVDGGLAYSKIIDANGAQATSAAFLANNMAGFSRFCSSHLSKPHAFGGRRGLEDMIYFTGEEDGGQYNPVGGAVWALDPATGTMHQVPAMGRGAWENQTEIDTGTTDHVAFILTDDTSPYDFNTGAGDGVEAAPVFMYVGLKNPAGDFLDRNGLKNGKLFVWVPDNGNTTPSLFHGAGSTSAGTWVEVVNSPSGTPSEDGSTGYDEYGYPTQGNLWVQARALGAFGFSRPEDSSADPSHGSRFVMSSTGSSYYDGGADSYGTLYTMDVDFSDIDNPTGTLAILYDGDHDAQQLLRSPDNVEWTWDGYIYAQEDKAFDSAFGPGAVNPSEAAIVRLDATVATPVPVRIGSIARSVVLDYSIPVPANAVDNDALEVGAWESSGIVDVSTAFGEAPGSLFLFDVQAHGIDKQDQYDDQSRISDSDLVEGGQLLFLSTPTAED